MKKLLWTVFALAVSAGVPAAAQTTKHLVTTGPIQGSQTQVNGTLELMRAWAKYLPTIDKSYTLSEKGAKALGRGEWAQARMLYRQAQIVLPSNQDAFYGLGQIADHEGDLRTAIADYRKNIYSHDGTYGTMPGDGYATNDDYRMLEFAILLSRAGQAAEAVRVYNRGIGFRNYEDHEQNVPVLFPTFGPAATQARYTPELMQAMAHAALSSHMDLYPDLVALNHARLAEVLAPNNAVMLFYLSYCLFNAYRDVNNKPLPAVELAQNHAAAAAAYQRALRLAQGATAEAIKSSGGGAWRLPG